MAQNGSNDNRSGADGLTPAGTIGAVLAFCWVAGISVLLWQLHGDVAALDGLQLVLMLIAVFMPVGLIWVAVFAARAAGVMHADVYRMQQTIDQMRQTHRAERAALADAVSELLAQNAGVTSEKQQPSQKNEPEPMPAPVPEPSADTAARFASRREVSRLVVPQPAPQMPADQPSLALDTTKLDEREVLTRADMIRALHFPNDENDTDGFAALRRALRDRDARHLVQASQDVLTLLSHDGIYMDDLRTEPAGADIWRRFAKGERGAAIAPLGTVRDGDTLDLAAARMRGDAIFRDAVHHFLRRFDQMLISFEAQATETDLLALAETRTARAFLLLGRATGTFR